MVVNERPTKRPRRRGPTADLPDLFTFPTPTLVSHQPFRDSIRTFLGRHARVTLPSSSLFPSLLTWQINLRVGPAVVVALDIIEEDVTRSCRSVYCDQCRVVGWSGHPVCRKRYHFIIRSSNNAESCDSETLFEFQQPLPLLQQEKWCNSIGATMAADTDDDVEEWVYNQLVGSSHVLHGVVHSNGFGHLLRLNGKEGGSTNLSGRDIMGLWDRLCLALSVRKVSVMDVSKKYGMDYRLLHAVTHGRSWYGNWGYEFQCGSYALTQDSYHKAVETVSTLPLHPFQFQQRKERTRLQSVIAFYQSFSNVQHQTTKDLFTFMLNLISKSREPTPSVEHNHDILCAWTAKDVHRVQQAMIKLLSAVREPNWVSRRALKGALFRTCSPELLDYSLEHLGCQLVANNMVVETRCNPDSTGVEYRLQQLTLGRTTQVNQNFPSEQQVLLDIKFLFESILHPVTMQCYAPQATRENVMNAATKILDCKQFIKDCKLDKTKVAHPSLIHLWCDVKLSGNPKDDFVVPPELIILPMNATLAHLKTEAAKAFQEVYAMFKSFEVEALLGYGSINDSITVKFLFGTSGTVHLKGKCLAKHGLNRFRMERGIESWVVDCTCGTKDDDGERMMACDMCSVWQHTRCAGVGCSDEIPAKFVCLRCKSLVREKSHSTVGSAMEVTKTTCRDMAARADGQGIATILNMTEI